MIKNSSKNQFNLVSRNYNNQFSNRQIEKYGLGAKALSIAGVDSEDHPWITEGGDLITYFHPVTGAISSGMDVYTDLSKGNYKDAGFDLLYAIPFAGGAAKLLSRSGKLLRLASRGSKTAQKILKAAESSGNFATSSPFQLGLASALGIDLAGLGKAVWDNREGLYEESKSGLKDFWEDFKKKPTHEKIFAITSPGGYIMTHNEDVKDAYRQIIDKQLNNFNKVKKEVYKVEKHPLVKKAIKVGEDIYKTGRSIFSPLYIQVRDEYNRRKNK